MPPKARASGAGSPPGRAPRSQSPAARRGAKAKARPSRSPARTETGPRRRAVVDAFRRFAGDGCDSIELKDLEGVLAKLDPVTWTPERTSRLVAAIDTKQDGKIDVEEFGDWLFSEGVDQAALQSQTVHAVFAYGTLRGDCGPKGDQWGVVRKYGARWKVCKVPGFRLYQGDGLFYPFAVQTNADSDGLVGTLLQFPDEGVAREAIAQCNRIEGFDPAKPSGGLYRRAVVEVSTPEENVLAFLYHQPMSDAPARFIAGGDWLRQEELQQPEVLPTGASLAALTAGGTRFATFGFGSNSVRQLRGRIGDKSLRGYPAQVDGQALAFAGPNHTWAHDEGAPPGGVATLVPRAGAVALGTVVFLTEKQLRVLDGFEGRPYIYDRRQFDADVLVGGSWCKTVVIAYIKQNSAEWYPPSEAYRCAVLRNVRGSFPRVRSLALRDCRGELRGEWRHPGHGGLGLGAFLFELGVRKQEPWTLPADIGRVKAKLVGTGIAGTAEALARALEELRHSPFEDEEELAIARRLLGLTGEDGDSSDDDSQAERAVDLGPAAASPHAAAADVGAANLLELPREPSCPGVLLVSSGQPLGNRVTMLGGMLAHPCMGVYPYKDGPAGTIVAAEHQVALDSASSSSSGNVTLPPAVRKMLAGLGVKHADFFFVVSDVSKGCFLKSIALNVMHHPWCYPSVRPGASAGAGRVWHVGLHVPEGGAITVGTSRRSLTGASRRDADPEDAVVEEVAPTSVHIHPGARGDLCCSPNNVRVSLKRKGESAAAFWAVCVEDSKRSAAKGAPRACASLHWLVANAEAATDLSRAAGAAASLGDFVVQAARQLGGEAPAVRAAGAALGIAGAEA